MCAFPTDSLGGNGTPKNGRQNGSSEDDVVEILVREERNRLRKELGLVEKKREHASRPVEGYFTAQQRPFTTILFGGLTWKHETLIQAVFEGLGYKAKYLPTPTVKAYQIGKEYANNGQCNPTYFTVGNLIEHLMGLEEQGIPRQEIIDKYVFFTAGACGPCRFGMYEAEYRLGLRNAGYEGFRVIILQQTDGLDQADIEAGLEMNLEFTLGLLNSFNIGDILNDLAFQIRPYEILPGSTAKALEECTRKMAEALKNKKHFRAADHAYLEDSFKGLSLPIEYSGEFLLQLFGKEITDAMSECRDILRQVKVDRTQMRPIVKITGEFWAQTTEGDGNFNMFSFLEKEGAQVLVEPIATWILYMLHQAKQELSDKKFVGIEPGNLINTAWKKAVALKRYSKTSSLLSLAELLYKREYSRLRKAMGFLPHELSDQYEMQRVGHPYYNSRVEGGEGHLEVAKNIYYFNKGLCHMVLSLKPFGCMPSTQSDGVQSAVLSHFKDILYLPIETSGEGEINAQSRVQMTLGEARSKARTEHAKALESTGCTIKQIREYASKHPGLQDPFYPIPKNDGVVGDGANFILHVAELMNSKKKVSV